MKVPEEVIEDAKAQLDPTHLEASAYLKRLKSLVDEQETLRSALEEERQATAEKYTTLDLEFARKEAVRRKEFEQELAQVINEFTAVSERLIKSVQDKVTAARLKKEAESRAAELRRSAGMRLRKQAASSTTQATGLPSISNAGSQEPPASETGPSPFEEQGTEIHERDRVRIIALDKEGVVESIHDDTYTILIGSLRFRAKRYELKLVGSASPQAKATAALPKGVSATVHIDENFSGELNIIGASVDEAEDRVDKYLDDAYLAGLDTIRIVHGHGKGALRQAVANLLKGHSHVKSYSLAPPNEGGAGATVVLL